MGNWLLDASLLLYESDSQVVSSSFVHAYDSGSTVSEWTDTAVSSSGDIQVRRHSTNTEIVLS